MVFDMLASNFVVHRVFCSSAFEYVLLLLNRCYKSVIIVLLLLFHEEGTYFLEITSMIF